MMRTINQTSINTKDVKEVLENAEITINLPRQPNQEENEKQQKNLTNWKNNTKTEHVTIPEFKIPKKLINVLLKGEEYEGLVLLGEGGVGKTCMTINSIKSNLEAKEWTYLSGYTTALALYENLYKSRDKQIIILDDIEGVFNNQTSLSILKAALWDVDGKRIVQYNSTTKHLEAPTSFFINAKIIILCNRIPKQTDPSMRAMMSRTISYEFNLTYAQKVSICDTFINEDTTLTPDQKFDVRRLLRTHTNRATKDFNFRTLRKAVAFIKTDLGSAEELFVATTKEDELKAAYFKLIGIKPVKEQARQFQELTGRSRRTFFNIKRSISAEVQREVDITLALNKQEENTK